MTGGSAAARGVLVLAATPIGNAEDASPRLRRELETADVVAAEDTRRLRRLAGALGVVITGRIVSYYDATEVSRAAELIEHVAGGARVVVLTDAGMPTVSDPGYRVVRAAVEAGLSVTVIPGPSAALAALAVSGLPSDRFCFEGFLPRKAGERARRLTDLATEQRTLVFFEAPHRLAAALTALAASFGGDRQAVACRELTKTYEEVRRGPLAELADWAADGVRGEVTLVVAGAPAAAGSATAADLAGLVAAHQREGLSRRDAIAAVAAETGRSKRVVYAAAVTAGVDGPTGD